MLTEPHAAATQLGSRRRRTKKRIGIFFPVRPVGAKGVLEELEGFRESARSDGGRGVREWANFHKSRCHILHSLLC